MRFVERAVIRPMRCAVLPQIGADHKDGFIDTGAEMLPSGTDQHVYVSVVAAREMARMIGWVPRAELDATLGDLASAEARIEELERELSDAEHALDAVHVLKAKGYTAQRKPGRPSTKAA